MIIFIATLITFTIVILLMSVLHLSGRANAPSGHCGKKCAGCPRSEHEQTAEQAENTGNSPTGQFEGGRP